MISRGLVPVLRRGLQIEVIPLETDMIIKGTLISALRHLDREVFAPGPSVESAQPLRRIG
mgnify:CR=1 FL=1